MVLLWKILVTLLLISPFVLAEDEYGPFVDLPLAHKLKGLDYEIKNDREEAMGIKEEVERQVKKQAEITHSIVNNGPKIAHIPSLTELLADLPLPLLQSVEKKRHENSLEKRETEAEMNLAAPIGADIHLSETLVSPASPPVSSPSTDTTTLLESTSTSKTASFPSQIPPPPLEFSQSELAPVINPSSTSYSQQQQQQANPGIAPAAYESSDDASILPPPSLRFAGNTPSFNSIPLPPQMPQLSSFDPSLLYQRQQPQPFQTSYNSYPNFYPEQQRRPIQQQFVQPPWNRFKQQGIPRIPRTRYQKRQSPQRSLEPSSLVQENYPPPIGYTSFIQAPMASVSVINGVPLKLQSSENAPPSNAQLLEAENTIYYPSQNPETTLTKHDLAYSRRQRMNTHPEPVLPDLPLPPVVAPV